MNLKKKTKAITVIAGLSAMALLFALAPASASGHETGNTCTFTVDGTTMSLDGDCTTDTAIEVPDGFTLDGQGHTITAIDGDGQFLGAVVTNELGATTMHVVDLTVTTDNLDNTCRSGVDRLRGILFRSADGTVESVTVTDIRKAGDSGCQEGNAIEISNPPFSFEPAPHTSVGHPDTKHVWVMNSTVERYQKTGILANGDVHAWVTNNKIVGFGPVDFIGQNGIQLGFGATGVLEGNEISGNDYTPDAASSVGILLFLSGTTVRDNLIFDNEVGISANFANGTLIENNRVVDSRTDGIQLLGSTNMTLLDNEVFRSGNNGINVAGAQGVFTDAHYNATDNAITMNLVQDSGNDGIVNREDAQGNTYTDNRLTGSGVLSCNDSSSGTGTEGTANIWEGNEAQAPSDPEGICTDDHQPGNGEPPGNGDLPEPDPGVECSFVQVGAIANQDTSITVTVKTNASYDLVRVNGDEDRVLGSFDGDQKYVDNETAVGKTYSYIVEIDGKNCGQVEVTAIPVFPGILVGALAAVGGLGAYGAIARHRKD